MSQKLLDVLTLGHCSHEFSWPRRSSDGHYYQVCLLCATEYQYDWQAMRRTARVNPTAPGATAAAQYSGHRGRKQTWVPRARRLKLSIPLRYRVRHGTAWRVGVIENLSQSGVLFHGQEPLPENTLVEMIFEMPEEISGQKNSTVVCQGRITRSQPQKYDSVENTALAASILDYKFLHSS
jgi:hypothetical protein